MKAVVGPDVLPLQPPCRGRTYPEPLERHGAASPELCCGKVTASASLLLPQRSSRKQASRLGIRPARTTGAGAGSAMCIRAVADQAVAAIEIHWSWPCGKPLSKYGWKPNARVRTCHEPSARRVRMR